LRRVGRGLYDWPRQSSVLKRSVPANVQSIVAAIARRDGIRVIVDGIVAAHRFGLTNAVPAKAEYWTDGPTRTVKCAARTVRFKHMNSNFMRWANRPAAPVVSALTWLGPTVGGDAVTIEKLRKQLPDGVKQDLVAGVAQLPTWAVPIAQQIHQRPAHA
jgi:hypothetical protein